jgi:hypothetical protein
MHQGGGLIQEGADNIDIKTETIDLKTLSIQCKEKICIQLYPSLSTAYRLEYCKVLMHF